MAQRAMSTLLNPVIIDYFSHYQLPEKSTILQVLGEMRIWRLPGIEGNGPFMFLALSDGSSFFRSFIATGTLPGEHSLVRINPSEKNKVVSLWVAKEKRHADFVFIQDVIKILDGDVTQGIIGNPVEIINIAD